ncbi:MAG: GNAT family N-acetyltransferase [Bilifractor sp.]
MNVDIKFENYRNRAAAYDGSREIGVCVFTRSDNRWIIEHTEVDPLYNGNGIAGKLVDAVVDHARSLGVKILPLCSYARGRMEKPEYADVLIR